MIEQILPSTLKSVDTVGDADPSVLFPAERLAIARAVDKRRREFTTVRACARGALDQLGIAPTAILPGIRGAPEWPVGVVGSMTHCEGYRAAVVGRSYDWAAIGIDAEPAAPLPEGVLEAVSLPQERRMLSVLASTEPAVPWDRLLFSAKESVFKSWYPIMHAELGFEDAVVKFDLGPGTFSARLLVDPPGHADRFITAITGRWICRDGIVATAVALDPSVVVLQSTHPSTLSAAS